MKIVCNCGTPLDYNGEPVVCPQCGAQNFLCPECNAPISIPKGAVAVSCPYCNATLIKEDITQDRLFFPVSYDSSQTFSKLHWFIQNRFGIPEDITTEFTPKSVELLYIPVYVYHIKSKVKEDIIEVDTRGIVANRDVWFSSHIDNYKFAVKSKIFYKADEIKGKVLEPKMTLEQATRRAYDYGETMAMRDIQRFNIKNARPEIDVNYDGLIYYPVYIVEYLYKGRRFRGLLDGTNGVVMYAEYPMGTKAKVALRTAGFLYMLISLAGGVLEGLMLLDVVTFLVVIGQGIIIGLLLILSAKSVKKGEEEIKTTDKKLVLSSLGRKFARGSEG